MKCDPQQIFGIPASSGIGDALQYSRHPEFYFLETQQKMKLCYIDRFGLYSNNPYVELVPTLNPTINLWGLNFPYDMGSPVYQNLSKLFDVSNIDKDIKPSMYRDIPEEKNNWVVISPEATKRIQKGWTREIPQPVVEVLVDEFKKVGKKVIQIGGHGDYEIKNADEDLRGMSVPETHDVISKSSLFIGVNSGMMHVAACTGIDMCVWLNTPVSNPPWESDMKKYTAHDWLYNSVKYLGPAKKEGVLPIGDFIKEIK